MKRRAGEIDGGAVAETIYNIRMTNAIERDCFILKVGNERALKLNIGCVLQIQVQGLDDDCARPAFRRSVIVGDVDLGIAATPKTFEDIVAAIESALL